MASPAHDVPALLTDDFPLALDRPFTRAQANALGITTHVLRRLVRLGYIRRLLKGVYVVAQVPDSLWLRGQALALVVPPGSVVTDWSACWLWTGIERPNAHLEIPQVSVFRPSGAGRLRNQLARSGERALLAEEVTPVTERLDVTTPLRTAWDLGRLQPAIIGLGGVDALLRQGTFEVAELVHGVERFRRRRGVVQLRWLSPLADGRAESLGESALRLRWRQVQTLPVPDLQIPVRDPGGTVLYRIDLGVEQLRFGAEYDGERWHGEDRQEHDAVRRERLRSEHGWTIEVFRRDDVYGAGENASRRLPLGLRAARRRLGLSSY